MKLVILDSFKKILIFHESFFNIDVFVAMEVQTCNKYFLISFKHDSTHLIWAMSLLVVKIKLLTFRDSAFIASRTGIMASVVAATILRAEQSGEKSRMMSDGMLPM